MEIVSIFMESYKKLVKDNIFASKMILLPFSPIRNSTDNMQWKGRKELSCIFTLIFFKG